MTLAQYIDNINKRYQLGNATEHTFRGDLQQLLENLVPSISATNEPKRQSCGAPDYILTKKDNSSREFGIPVGFIEAKDIGDKDLEGAKKTGNKEQFDRYKASLSNLIFTDYLDFHLYIDGIFITKIAIAKLEFPSFGGAGVVVPLPENFISFTNFIKDFCSHIGQTIKSSKKLAEMMAGKARLLSDVIERALTSDETNQNDSTLKDQMNAFKEILIHDITPKGFADVYAQTIAYGMFAARLHDPTLPTFSRQEASELIPRSNPFLRKLFGYIAGPDLDDRIKWIVDSLVEIFLACNVEEILKNYGKTTKMEDPIIHFYETFLSEYDPKLRKARGVWYTPAPVVNFIVRAVDDILKTEFDLPQGLADTSKTKIKVNQQGKQVEQEVHKVQILDPATGTGTFLAEVVKHIHKKFEGQKGIWSNYVEKHLLPRLNGFELLMASYAMAHLQLDLLLTETGYKPSDTFPSNGGVPNGRGGQRLRVYLTNSLEESHPDTGTLFANWLSSEANEANHIKRDSPVMCVIGNPPYAVSSTNKNEWIEKLISDYKKDLNEKSYNSLSDDYVKFIRYGQHYIEKNGSGILAYISNNSFIDGLVFRQMRKHLLESFDQIYILDLHGNAKKKEVCPDGSADQNVFDIMQGVSINIFMKTGKKKKGELGKVLHLDLQGKREFKYDFLNENNLQSLKWNSLEIKKPNYFFINKNLKGESLYNKGISINDLFKIKAAGIKTHRDAVVIGFNAKELKSQIDSYLSTLQNTNIEFTPSKCKSLTYRPFDNRIIYYETELVVRHRQEQIKHSFFKNYSLVLGRQTKNKEINHFFISNTLSEMKTAESSTGSYHFQLYSYPNKNGQQTIGQTTERIPNLNPEIIQQIAEKLGLKFVAEKFPSFGGVAESRGGKNTVGVAESRSGENIVDVAESRGGRNTRNYMDLPFNPNLKERAKELRQAGNLSEVLFWNQVKNKQFKGFDFDRQKIVGNYIVDFFCTNCKVVIEIDGSSHDDKQEYDAARDTFLQNLGLTVIHIPIGDVMKNMGGVMEMLFNHPALKGTPPMEGNLKAEAVGTPPMEGNLKAEAVSTASVERSLKTEAVGTASVEGSFAPIDILDYIYAVLHSPTYREKYKEFLKIDFPRVPYPKDASTFWQLVKLGGEIRQIHLLESAVVNKYITQYPEDGDNVVRKTRFVTSPPLEGCPQDGALNSPPLEGCPQDGVVGKVFINETQYFDNVPQNAWEFYIGGYQPAQKWLKDRKERTLEFEDILHYQKIIVALSETHRLMKEIDKIEIE
jgi:very-short-patch-repair endonuclease